jgi:aromatic ring hydroxylase
MAARTGEQFLEGLRGDKRELWLGSERIDDATTHPALAGGARAIADVFDVQHKYADDCLMPDPETGEPINVSHMIPRSLDDLLRRRRGLERISAATVGMMGRTPDYMNVTFAGFAGRWKDWVGADGSNARGADNLVQFQKRLARADISLTHTLVHPTVSRAKEMQILGNPVPMHKVGETGDSVIISGARILATLAPYSDELAVYPGFPLIEDGTDDYALSFSIPMDTPGLIFLCRDSTLTPESDRFDRPMSTRFDEQDAFVIFDEVEVPKDALFIDCNRELYNTVMAISWWPNIMQQTTVRALTKLEFAYALACRMAAAVGDESDITTDMLGELACYVEMTRNAIVASEQLCRDYGDGVVFPDDRALHPMRSLLTEWIPRAMEIIMLIGSHNLLATPSRVMLDDERLRPLIDVYLDTANEDGAEARAALFRLAWDFVGSGLGSRVELYERFYLGSRTRNRKMMHISSQETTGWKMGSSPEIRSRGNELIDGILGTGQ